MLGVSARSRRQLRVERIAIELASGRVVETLGAGGGEVAHRAVGAAVEICLRHGEIAEAREAGAQAAGEAFDIGMRIVGDLEQRLHAQGERPGPDGIGLLAADAAGPTPAEALSGRDFGTVLGPVRFDDKGDLTVSPYRAFRFDGTRFVSLETD